MFVRNLILLILVTISLNSCRKDNKLSVKYEITTTTSISNPPTTIITKIGLRSADTFSNFTSGSYWTSTIDVETSYRPLTITLNPQTIYLSAVGSATLNIYVNGKLKATSTTQSTFFSNAHMITGAPLSVTIQ